MAGDILWNLMAGADLITDATFLHQSGALRSANDGIYKLTAQDILAHPDQLPFQVKRTESDPPAVTIHIGKTALPHSEHVLTTAQTSATTYAALKEQQRTLKAWGDHLKTLEPKAEQVLDTDPTRDADLKSQFRQLIEDHRLALEHLDAHLLRIKPEQSTSTRCTQGLRDTLNSAYRTSKQHPNATFALKAAAAAGFSTVIVLAIITPLLQHTTTASQKRR